MTKLRESFLPATQGAGILFCWQHKDQASKVPRLNERLSQDPILERTSVDSLADRFGLLNKIPNKKSQIQRGTYPIHNGQVPGRRDAVPSGGKVQAASNQTPPISRQKEKSRRPPSLLAALCCMISEDLTDDDEPGLVEQWPDHTTYPVKRRSQAGRAAANEVCAGKKTRAVADPYSGPERGPRYSQASRESINGSRPLPQAHSNMPLQSGRKPLSQKPAWPLNRPPLPRNHVSQTERLLAMIPKTLSPNTTSLLLTELAKPISDMDEEGYIYIFWLSNADKSPAPSSKMISSLLAAPASPDGRKEQTRATKLLLETAVEDDDDAAGENHTRNKTVLVKIGRASNVQRRMNEWTRQCSFDLSLIRYYPYVPSRSHPPSAARSPSPRTSPQPSVPPMKAPRKVPHVHRVERLIHIELAESRMKKACSFCSKEHREWFSVDASREGIRAVDEVIRRWVDWAQQNEEVP